MNETAMPPYVMFKVTVLPSYKVKISLVDKRHNDELDCKVHQLDLETWHYQSMKQIIDEYKNALADANVI